MALGEDGAGDDDLIPSYREEEESGLNIGLFPLLLCAAVSGLCERLSRVMLLHAAVSDLFE